jgi:3-(3-hydroxy-phenyl)propionate hydroxylase
MNERHDVAVVGFGPAGAVCAGLLGRLGVRTLVVDRSREIYDKPRAFALDHEIMRVFQNLGIAAEVSRHVAPFEPAEYYGADGQLIKRLGAVAPPWPLGWCPSMVFSQPPVEAALRRAVGGMAGVEVALGTALVGIEQSRDEVVLRLADDAGASRVARARYAIGCDGAGSTVRGLLGIAHDDLEFDEPWLVIDAIVNDDGAAKLPRVGVHRCEPSRPSTYLVGPGAHRRWEIMLLPGEDPREMETEAQVWRLLGRWITPADGRIWRAASYRFHALVAREWRRGRILIAGDAAHQQPPFLGQGMCQGVRDVANLGWKLAMVLAGAAGDRLLDTYEAERRPHVHRLTATIRAIGRIVCELDPAAARARDSRLIAEAGGAVRTVPRQELIPPLESGLLSPARHAANGTLFPQPRVLAERGTPLLDDLAGTGFRIVGAGAALPQTPRFRALCERFHARVIRVVPDARIPGNAAGVDGVLSVAEADGVVAGWFDRHECSAAIVRPDHYVYGVAATADELGRQLESLAADLSRG